MIVNAHCHRNFNDDSCVQVALYDNRLEVTSPGGLYNGLTLENAMNGHSRLRNRSLANVFCQIGLIEAWGTGLRRIKSLAEDFELPVPEFIETYAFFRVNLFRKVSEVEKLYPGFGKVVEAFCHLAQDLEEQFLMNRETSSEKLQNDTEIEKDSNNAKILQIRC